MWSLTLRLREAGMATLCCIVATAQPPSHGSAAGGAPASAPVSLWQAVTAARRWIYKVASYSISRSCFYIENLPLSQTTDGWGWDCIRVSSSTAAVLFVFCVLLEHLVLICFSLCLFLRMFRFFLKFFLKCNQNCLKNAGNPRDMRRFQVRCNCLQAVMCGIVAHSSWDCLSFSFFFLQSTRHECSLCFPKDKSREKKTAQCALI